MTQAIAVDEKTCAKALGMSVAWLRKDRAGRRTVPFFKLGRYPRYDMEAVQAALRAQQVGGVK